MLDACITARKLSADNFTGVQLTAIANANDVKFLMDRDQVAKISQQCNIKKGELTLAYSRRDKAHFVAGAKLAEEQSTHLHLCMLIHDLTTKYGPVIRQGKVTGVLDAAFDVVIVS